MYKNLALIYDKMLYDIDYKSWSNFIEGVLTINGIKPLNILDLACGTGNLTLELAKKGYKICGIDISNEMLSYAHKKFSENEFSIPLYQQDIINFEMNGGFDLILCMLDSVNHIIDRKNLEDYFKNVSSHLNINGLFIFDINTEYKFKNILSNNVFYEINDDISYIWQNNYIEKNKICEFDITIFIRSGNLYKRFDDYHEERAYSEDEIEKSLKNANLKIINKYSDIRFTKEYNNSERIFFVCQKRKED